MENNKMIFCEETVSTMMENFIKELCKEDHLPDIENIDAEINDVKGAISNERLWQKGSDTKEEILMFEQNIANHIEYINRLISLRANLLKLQTIFSLEI